MQADYRRLSPHVANGDNVEPNGALLHVALTQKCMRGAHQDFVLLPADDQFRQRRAPFTKVRARTSTKASADQVHFAFLPCRLTIPGDEHVSLAAAGIGFAAHAHTKGFVPLAVVNGRSVLA